MNSMRLRPPRPPGERASRERQPTEMLCTAEKVSVFGAKRVCSANRAARFRLCLPLEGKVPEGRMRCRFRVAESFTGEKVTLCHKDAPLALHLISQLTLTAVSLRLGQAWLLTSPGGQFTTKPLLRSPRGEAKDSSRQDV